MLTDNCNDDDDTFDDDNDHGKINIFSYKVQTIISFYLLNKMLRCVAIILLVELSKYLESFGMI